MQLDISATALAIYFYLLYIEDRKTYQCCPSCKTIGKALKIKSKGTVAKYVRELEDKAHLATNLVNGIKQANGSIKALSPKQVADILGHTTSQITEMYYVKKDTSRLNGITDGFEI